MEPTPPTTSIGEAPTAAHEVLAAPAGQAAHARAAVPARNADGSDPAALAPAPPAIDLDSPEWYLNRELTWLEFNRRIFNEALDERNPLLERVKFLAIVASNFDEFFMKRIGGLKQQSGAGVTELSIDGRTPEQQIRESQAVVRSLEEQQRILAADLIRQLDQAGVRISDYSTLSQEDRNAVREHYVKNIFPLVTPLAIGPAHPFPFLSNLSLNLLVTVRHSGEESADLVRIKVPVGEEIPRFLQIGDRMHFVPLEDVIAKNLDLLFPGMQIESYELFRVTRNAITEIPGQQAEDLMSMVESELRDRKFAPIVRLEVSKGMDPTRRGMLAAELGVDEATDVFEVDGLMAKPDLFQIAALKIRELHDPPHHPIDHPLIAGATNLFHLIRKEGPLLLQHPYESFVTSVERFVKEASEDPKVLAIKMTIYRTAAESKIIDYLIEASQNGKQVAVAVELKARFDESSNIRWANRLERAGIHVSYGVLGLKTHGKIIFVLRRDYDGLRRYAHFGTGNYNADTARVYSDLGLLTCDEAIGEDLTELFNFLTSGNVPNRRYRKLLPAPTEMKQVLLTKINREIAMHSAASPGLIRFKVNSIEDKDISKALYQASRAGVTVELIVRDTCRLRPGVPGLSDRIKVVALVGRFLEHARIYYFRNGGNEEYYISSADCMTHKMQRRIEVTVPVEGRELHAQLRHIFELQLAPQHSLWVMQSDGSYVRSVPETAVGAGAQERLIQEAQERA
ncbi:MAG TPA: polyphosphate kinase 1, partial [Nitrospiria bacterium]|nr:polyphosphate kinase 1 [Nitrospiria bacterium]